MVFMQKALPRNSGGLFYMDLVWNYLAKTGYFLLNTLKLPNKMAP